MYYKIYHNCNVFRRVFTHILQFWTSLINFSDLTNIMMVGPHTSRPKGVIFFAVLSAITGILVFVAIFLGGGGAGESSNPILGYDLGFDKYIGSILAVFATIYIIIAIGFWKAYVWTLSLYKLTNQTVTITNVLTQSLIISQTPNVDPIWNIIPQLISLIYTFVINHILGDKNLKAYFKNE